MPTPDTQAPVFEDVEEISPSAVSIPLPAQGTLSKWRRKFLGSVEQHPISAEGYPTPPPTFGPRTSQAEPKPKVGAQKTVLSPEEEKQFRQWYGDTEVKQYHMDPNPDSPEHHYDYRGAWKAGVRRAPDANGQMGHWPDQWKMEGHPTQGTPDWPGSPQKAPPGPPKLTTEEMVRQEMAGRPAARAAANKAQEVNPEGIIPKGTRGAAAEVNQMVTSQSVFSNQNTSTEKFLNALFLPLNAMLDIGMVPLVAAQGFIKGAGLLPETSNQAGWNRMLPSQKDLNDFVMGGLLGAHASGANMPGQMVKGALHEGGAFIERLDANRARIDKALDRVMQEGQARAKEAQTAEQAAQVNEYLLRLEKSRQLVDRNVKALKAYEGPTQKALNPYDEYSGPVIGGGSLRMPTPPRTEWERGVVKEIQTSKGLGQDPHAIITALVEQHPDRDPNRMGTLVAQVFYKDRPKTTPKRPPEPPQTPPQAVEKPVPPVAPTSATPGPPGAPGGESPATPEPSPAPQPVEKTPVTTGRVSPGSNLPSPPVKDPKEHPGYGVLIGLYEGSLNQGKEGGNKPLTKAQKAAAVQAVETLIRENPGASTDDLVYAVISGGKVKQSPKASPTEIRPAGPVGKPGPVSMFSLDEDRYQQAVAAVRKAGDISHAIIQGALENASPEEAKAISGRMWKEGIVRLKANADFTRPGDAFELIQEPAASESAEPKAAPPSAETKAPEPEAPAPDEQGSLFAEETPQTPAPTLTTTELVPDGVKVYSIEMPVKDIVVDPDLVPQWKQDADPATGVVKGKELQGKYERPSNPIVVWQLNDGRNVIVTGRHRLAHAKRVGEATIPTTVVREADGFTRANAVTLDAEMNIRDGMGEFDDYYTYFANSDGLDRPTAESRGLLRLAKAQDAWSLARLADDDLQTLYRNGGISGEQAAAIAEAAPNDGGLQRAGAWYAKRNPKASDLGIASFLNQIKDKKLDRPDTQMSMFGDDSAVRMAEARAKEAEKMLAELKREKSALSLGNKSKAQQDAARKAGIDITNPEQVKARLATIAADLAKLENYAQNGTDRDLSRQIDERLGLAVSSTGNPKANNVLNGIAQNRVDLDRAMALLTGGEIEDIPQFRNFGPDLDTTSKIFASLQETGESVESFLKRDKSLTPNQRKLLDHLQKLSGSEAKVAEWIGDVVGMINRSTVKPPFIALGADAQDMVLPPSLEQDGKVPFGTLAGQEIPTDWRDIVRAIQGEEYAPFTPEHMGVVNEFLKHADRKGAPRQAEAILVAQKRMEAAPWFGKPAIDITDADMALLNKDKPWELPLDQKLQYAENLRNRPQDSPVAKAVVRRGGEERVVSIGSDRANKIFQKTVYGGEENMPWISLREAFQNSFDAYRWTPEGKKNGGAITVQIDGKDRSIRVEDHGAGMSPKTAKTALVDPGVSVKAPDSSGGFGVGILTAFSNAADQSPHGGPGISVETRWYNKKTNKIQKTTMFGSGVEFSKGRKGKGLSVHTEDLPPDHPEGTGTTLHYFFPEIVPFDVYRLEQSTRNFLLHQRSPNAIDVRIRERYDSEFSPVVVESNTTSKDWMLGNTIETPGATMDIYLSPESVETQEVQLTALCNGLPQFQNSVSLWGQNRGSVVLPREIVVDIHPTVNPEEGGYPFMVSREGLHDVPKNLIDDYVKNALYGDSIKRETEMYRKTLREGPLVGGTPFRVIDATGGKIPAKLQYELAYSPYLEPLAKELHATFKKMQEELAKWNPKYKDAVFSGFNLEDGTGGVNVHGTKVGQPDGNNLVFVNPWVMIEGLRNERLYAVETQPYALARHLNDILAHELAHQIIQSDDNRLFSDTLTNNGAILRPIMNLADGKIARILEAKYGTAGGYQSGYDLIASHFDALDPHWSGIDSVLRKVSTPALAEDARVGGGEGAAGDLSAGGTPREGDLRESDLRRPGSGPAVVRDPDAAGRRPGDFTDRFNADIRSGQVEMHAGLSPWVGGIDKTFDRVLKPHVQDFADFVKDIFNPSEAAIEGRGALRESSAKMANANWRAQKALKSVRSLTRRMTPEQQNDLIDRFEHHQSMEDVSRELDGVAQTLYRLNDMIRSEVDEADPVNRRIWREIYWPNFWKETSELRRGERLPKGTASRRDLQGPGGFTKEKEFATRAEGLAAGYTPLYDNVADYWEAKTREMMKFAMAKRLWNDLNASNMTRYVREGRHGRLPDGYAWIDDRMAKVFRYSGIEHAYIPGGEYAVPKEIAQVINRYLSPGIRRQPLVNFLAEVGNLQARTMLAFSEFHAGTTAFNAFYSKLALAEKQIIDGNYADAAKSLAQSPFAFVSDAVRGHKLRGEFGQLDPHGIRADLKPYFDALESGGFRAAQDPFLMSSFRQRMQANWVGGEKALATLQGFPALIESISAPLMEHYVPDLKMAAAFDLAKYEIKRLGPAATHEMIREAMMKAVDTIDNRFGQLVYDNLHWNNTFKAIMQMAVLSLGWNVGTGRELGGGIFDSLKALIRLSTGRGAEFTHRMAYLLALNAAHMTMAAITQTLMTGKGPTEFKDYFYPKTGEVDDNGNPLRMSFPDYGRDEWNFTHRPGKTLENKLHPLPVELYHLVTNRDYSGTMIRDPEQDWYAPENVKKMAKHVLTSSIPISIRMGLDEYELSGSIPRSLMPALGMTPAPASVNRSPAQQALADYLDEKPHATRTPSEAARRTALRELNLSARKGQNVYGEVQKMLRSGLITTKDAADVMQWGGKPKPFAGIEQLTSAQMATIYEKATPEERKTIGDRVQQKLRREAQKPGAVTPTTIERLQKAGFPTGGITPTPMPEALSDAHVAGAAALLAYGPGPKLDSALAKQGMSAPPPQALLLASQAKQVEARIRQDRLASLPPSDRAFVSALLALRDRGGKASEETA